jgi:hypothetical protein
MVATAQISDYRSERGGPGPVGGDGRGNAGAHRGRTDQQNRKFHALCADIAKSNMEWAGCRRTAEEWKNLLISGHAKATGRESEIVIGLEGEMVQIRESSARMSVARSASLIDYVTAWAVSHGVRIRETT